MADLHNIGVTANNTSRDSSNMSVKSAVKLSVRQVIAAHSPYKYCLSGLMVKASAPGAEDLGFESRLRRDFSGSSHTSDLNIDIPVATLPSAWH